MSATRTLPASVSLHDVYGHAGSLDGFAIDCSLCGRVCTVSLHSMAEGFAREHIDWHAGAGVFAEKAKRGPRRI